MDKIFAPIKQRVMYYIDTLNIKKETFFKKTGISASNFKGNGAKSELGGDKIVKILTIFPDLNPEWLLTGKGEMLKSKYVDIKVEKKTVNDFSMPYDPKKEKQRVPLYDIEATAGIIPKYGIDNSNPVDYIQIPNLPKCDGAVYVTGNSMYPLIYSGDMILYKKINDIKNNIFYGEMYLISIDMEGDIYVTVKYVHKSYREDHIKLVSYNKDFDDQDVPLSQVRALAFVKASIRINSAK